MKAYKRTEDGTTTCVTEEEGLNEGRAAMLDRVTVRAHVRKIPHDSGRYDITYKDDRHVVLVPFDVEPESTAEAAGMTAPAEALSWTVECVRSGITVEEASDDYGLMGVPGTWYRVRRGVEALLTTRNRGDALRLYQRTVGRISATEPACEGHSAEEDGETIYCNGPCDRPRYPFTVTAGETMYFNDRAAADRCAAQYGATVTVN